MSLLSDLVSKCSLPAMYAALTILDFSYPTIIQAHFCCISHVTTALMLPNPHHSKSQQLEIKTFFLLMALWVGWGQLCFRLWVRLRCAPWDSCSGSGDHPGHVFLMTEGRNARDQTESLKNIQNFWTYVSSLHTLLYHWVKNKTHTQA